jgi:hypothetical protein
MTSATSIAKTLQFGTTCLSSRGAFYRLLENRKRLNKDELQRLLIALPCIKKSVTRA